MSRELPCLCACASGAKGAKGTSGYGADALSIGRKPHLTPGSSDLLRSTNLPSPIPIFNFPILHPIPLSLSPSITALQLSDFLQLQWYYAPAVIIARMLTFGCKTAGRAALRRSHLPNRQTNISKRHSSNNNNTPHTKDVDDAANGTSIPVPSTVPTVPLWQRLGPLSRGFQAYGRSQRKRPYTTQFISSLVIYFLGDLSAQSINGDDYDPARTLRALVISAGSSIPSYQWLVLLIF
jgi:hypothetical protein